MENSMIMKRPPVLSTRKISLNPRSRSTRLRTPNPTVTASKNPSPKPELLCIPLNPVDPPFRGVHGLDCLPASIIDRFMSQTTLMVVKGSRLEIMEAKTPVPPQRSSTLEPLFRRRFRIPNLLHPK